MYVCGSFHYSTHVFRNGRRNAFSENTYDEFDLEEQRQILLASLTAIPLEAIPSRTCAHYWLHETITPCYQTQKLNDNRH